MGRPRSRRLRNLVVCLAMICGLSIPEERKKSLINELMQVRKPENTCSSISVSAANPAAATAYSPPIACK